MSYSTHKQRTARKAEKRSGEAGRDRDGEEVRCPPLSHLSKREAPQAKPPAGRGFPNYSKQSSLRAARVGVAALVILEYGSMM